MKNWLTTTVFMCALALATNISAHDAAQGTAGKPATDKQGAAKGQSSTPDTQFMQTAAMDGMAEVAHGKLAASNADSDEVRKFGQRMVDDHSKANGELKGLATQKQVTLPTELDQKHQAMQQKLEKMKGAEFDRAYMQHMVQAHKQAVTLFEREAKSGKDAETRAWAEKTLPTLQEHLKMATDVAGKVGKGAKQ